MVGNYNYLPDDHYAKVGISFQKYLGDQIDRAGFADEVTAYWATAEVGAH
jgi:raffinose/stachyose/melibiose transport system substrate-binding protein